MSDAHERRSTHDGESAYFIGSGVSRHARLAMAQGLARTLGRCFASPLVLHDTPTGEMEAVASMVWRVGRRVVGTLEPARDRSAVTICVPSTSGRKA